MVQYKTLSEFTERLLAILDEEERLMHRDDTDARDLIAAVHSKEQQRLLNNSSAGIYGFHHQAPLSVEYQGAGVASELRR